MSALVLQPRFPQDELARRWHDGTLEELRRMLGALEGCDEVHGWTSTGFCSAPAARIRADIRREIASRTLLRPASAPVNLLRPAGAGNASGALLRASE